MFIQSKYNQICFDLAYTIRLFYNTLFDFHNFYNHIQAYAIVTGA